MENYGLYNSLEIIWKKLKLENFWGWKIGIYFVSIAKVIMGKFLNAKNQNLFCKYWKNRIYLANIAKISTRKVLNSKKSEFILQIFVFFRWKTPNYSTHIKTQKTYMHGHSTKAAVVCSWRKIHLQQAKSNQVQKKQLNQQ